MRIVHILASLGAGGVQNFVFSLAYEQSRLGHKVYLILTDLSDDDLNHKQERILTNNRVSIVRLNRHIGKKGELIHSLFRCRQVVNQIKPDIINSHSSLWHFYGAIACLGKSFRQICTVHSTPEFWPRFVRLFCNNKPIIYCSEAAFKGRVQHNKRVVTIPNGISPAMVRTNDITDLRKEYNLSPCSKVVISVGNLRPEKNYKNLITLAELLKGTDIHFFICGAVNNSPAYDNPTLYEGHSNLHYLGPRSDVSAIENGANVFLSSSIYEGLPIAVLEAYFNGIPCVLSPIVQHADIAGVPKVWLPKEFTPEAFVDAIFEALSVTETHDMIFEERKPYIEMYSISRTAYDYLQFYNHSILQ